jgi:hypothetical protein
VKKLFPILILVLFLSIGCAAQNEIMVKDDSLKPSSPPLVYIGPERITLDKTVDPNLIKISNLVWDTSDNLIRIKKTPDYKFIFDLGVAFQIGIGDGIGGRKTTRDERINMYPIIKEYSLKDKIKFIDLNVAYEGGFELAAKYVQQNREIISAPPPEKKITETPEKVIKGKTGAK